MTTKRFEAFGSTLPHTYLHIKSCQDVEDIVDALRYVIDATESYEHVKQIVNSSLVVGGEEWRWRRRLLDELCKVLQEKISPRSRPST